jgi:hypothetical protein
MALYLNERELGFDNTTIGFPSIQGCMAIVYVTPNGLFGFHNYGGSAAVAWPARSGAFGQYFNAHFLRRAGTRLYGATYVAIRGYDAPAATNWTAELTAFATALGFAGKIRGYNLSGSPVPPSAYVEFRKSGDKAEIWVKQWADADKTTGPNTDRANHKIAITRAGGVTTVENQNAQVVTNVATAGLHLVHSTRLRQ